MKPAAGRRVLVFALAFVAAAVAPAARAEAASTVFIEELTWPELRERIAAGSTTVIVPVGGTEQNGPHMTLGKHNARVRALAALIAQRLGDALVAPVIAYVPEGALAPPTGHMRFPGTITVPGPAFDATLESAGQSFRLHGFRDIVFIGDHGSYQANLRSAAARLNRAFAGTPARAHAIDEYYRLVERAYPARLRERGFGDAEIGTHAGLADTSLTLALAPDAVRRDRLAAAPSARDGVVGDPRRSSAALGEAGVDVIVAGTVAAIRAATARR